MDTQVIERPEEKSQGLIRKYRVEKVDDPQGKHEDCSYFVLDPKHDLKARSTLIHYAALARLDGEERLYLDLMNWVMQLDSEDRLKKTRAELNTLERIRSREHTQSLRSTSQD